NLEIRVNGVLQTSLPLSELSQVTVNGSNDNDTLTVDYSGGAISIPIFYNGGAGTDAMVVNGYNVGTVRNSFLPDSSGHRGTILIGSNPAINYTGLEPVTLGGAAAGLIIDIPDGDGNNGGFLEEHTGGVAGVSQVRSSLGTIETTTFVNPTNSLTVNFGDDGETVTVAALDVGFRASLILNGGAGTDTASITGALTLGSAATNGNVT